jgi:hypothetical protein
MENRVKGWCAGDEPCSSSTKKQTAQTLQAKMLFLSRLFEFERICMNIARMLYGFVMKEETPEFHAFIESHCRNLIAEPIGSLHCFCNCTI